MLDERDHVAERWVIFLHDMPHLKIYKFGICVKNLSIKVSKHELWISFAPNRGDLEKTFWKFRVGSIHEANYVTLRKGFLLSD